MALKSGKAMSSDETPKNRNLLTLAEEDFLNKFLSKLSGWSLTRIILIGLLPRLLLMPFVAHPFDVQAWYNYAEGVIQGGLDFGGVLASLRPLWLLTFIPIAYL